MADEQVNQEVEPTEDEFDKWLSDALADDDPVVEQAEEEADAEEQDALKIAKKTEYMVAKKFEQDRVEAKVAQFLAGASDLEKEALAVFRTGDEDEKQIDKLINMVKTKVAALGQEDAAAAEAKIKKAADEQAKAAYGTGPIPPGQKGLDEEEILMKKIAEGDMNALFEAVVTLPPV